MRHSSFFQLVALLSSLLLAGCGSLRNEINPDQLGLESAKLVVSGFLSPQDTVLAVRLTQSRTVVGDSISSGLSDGSVTKATVTLSDGSRTIALRYGANSYQYYSAPVRQMRIVAGRTYTLDVVTAEGQRATATCTIPPPVSLSTVQIDSLTENSRTRRYFVRATWQDPAGQANYYQVAGILRTTIPETYGLNAKPRSYVYANLNFDDDNRGLFDDATTDGTVFTSGRAYIGNTTLVDGKAIKGFTNQFQGSVLTVNLLAVDASYYQYRSAVIRQGRVRGNPFAEPVLIPSNVQGALGCFAGYNNTSVVLSL